MKERDDYPGVWPKPASLPWLLLPGVHAGTLNAVPAENAKVYKYGSYN